MEKEKKTTKTKTKVKERKNTDIVFTKDVKTITKVISLILVFLSSSAAIFVFVFGIITSIKVANTTKVELLHDNFSATFISNVNNISITETEDIIEGYGSKVLFIIFDIVIPCLAIIAIAIITIILAKKAIDFVNSINKEKDLYNKKKLNTIEKMACLIETILTISFIIFNNPSILLYLLISLLLFIVIGLFRKCVDDKE